MKAILALIVVAAATAVGLGLWGMLVTGEIGGAGSARFDGFAVHAYAWAVAVGLAVFAIIIGGSIWTPRDASSADRSRDRAARTTDRGLTHRLTGHA